MIPTHLTDAIRQAARDEPMESLIPDVVPGRILHVDGDYLVYWSAIGEADKVGLCRTILLNKVESMRTMSGAERVVVHLTDRHGHKGWRRVISTIQPYQDQRAGSKKPTNWDATRTWLEQYIGPAFHVKTWFDREADDAMAFASAKNGWQHTVIATKDKDMRMIPGIHIVWDTYELVTVTGDTFGLEFDDLIYGPKWFWLQMLIGDAADYIPGVQSGFGKAAALDAISMSVEDDIGFDVLSVYKRFHGADAYSRFAEIAALLWLRTDKAAAVDNFLTVCAKSMPEHEYQRVVEATNTLHQRIDAHAQEIDRLASKAREAQTVTAAELLRSLDW